MDYVVRLRCIFIIFVVLPVSIIIKFLKYVGDKNAETHLFIDSDGGQNNHRSRVEKVAEHMRKIDPCKDGLVCTARNPKHSIGMRNLDYKRVSHSKVDLSSLRSIIMFDKKEKIIKVEPMVTICQITRTTLPASLSIPVVSDLDDLTVGGLINGFGIGASSFKYGSFSEMVISMEIVLADGQVVIAKEDNEYSDLFYGVPWSQGTLGILVSAEIKLIRVPQYVKVTYKPIKGVDATCLRGVSEKLGLTNDRSTLGVEGIIYNPANAVIVIGEYCSLLEATRAGNVRNSIGWWFKPWFYQHAKTALDRGQFTEYIPIKEYYQRHRRSYFWGCKLIIPFADRWWFRCALGWLMPPNIFLLKATQTEAMRNYYHSMLLIQNVLVPDHKLHDALQFIHREMEIYPIWVCPIRLFYHGVKTMVCLEKIDNNTDRDNSQVYSNIGICCAPAAVQRDVFNCSEAVKTLEEWVTEHHGFQSHLGVTELSEVNFWRMFNREHYQQCRAKYGAAGTFMNVYDKCKKDMKFDEEVKEAP